MAVAWPLAAGLALAGAEAAGLALAGAEAAAGLALAAVDGAALAGAGLAEAGGLLAGGELAAGAAPPPQAAANSVADSARMPRWRCFIGWTAPMWLLAPAAPAQSAALGQADETEHGDAQRHQTQQAYEHQRRVELEGGVVDQKTQPALGAHELAHHRAQDRQRAADLEAAEHAGQRRGRLHPAQDLPAIGP